MMLWILESKVYIQAKNLSNTQVNILMNFWSERYLICAVLPTIESKLLPSILKTTFIREI